MSLDAGSPVTENPQPAGFGGSLGSAASWEAANQRFLAIAMQWLRLRLEHAAGGGQPIVAPATPTAVAVAAASRRDDAPGSLDRFLAAARRATLLPDAPAVDPDRSAGATPATPGPAADAGSAPGTQPEAGSFDSVEAAATALDVARSAEPAPGLVTLGRAFGLSRFEEDLLLLCVAMELDPGLGERCAAAQHDQRRTYPTFALAFELFDNPAWEAASPSGGLRYWRLIEISQAPGQPLTTSLLRADERIADFVKGLNEFDDRLDSLVLAIDGAPTHDVLAPSQERVVAEIERRLRLAGTGPLPVINLVGRDVETKRLVAAATSAVVGRRSYVVPADGLPSAPADLDGAARLWRRESILGPVALYLDAQDIDPAAADGPARVVDRFATRAGGLIFLGTRDVWPARDTPSVPLEATRSTRAEQQRQWVDALGGDEGDDGTAREIADGLAGQFRLTVNRMGQIVRDVETSAPGSDGGAPSTAGGIVDAERIWDACRVAVRPRMDALAQRLDAKATWDDIVLPSEELDLLHRIASQVRQRTTVYETWKFGERMNRGMGISALFAGPSGTGKSMAAEVIANALRLNLYRIDLSAVVSKYIGETEKNLRRVFDAAEDGGALLFFDEADALFGKRSEVKDSHDRYANIEINYLLQRIEEYSGVAILATNLRTALDTAFLRRLRFIVTFPFPAAAERRQIWEKVFPAGMPGRDGLDLDRLARLPATGGMIHNIALNAAFAGADAGGLVTMPLALEAARTEFRKQELPVVDRDFLWVPPLTPAAAPTTPSAESSSAGSVASEAFEAIPSGAATDAGILP